MTITKRIFAAAALTFAVQGVLYAGPLEQLSGNDGLLPENSITIPIPQKPAGTDLASPETLPDLGSKVYIPREYISRSPGPAGDVPFQQQPVFPASKTPFTEQVNSLVHNILELSSRNNPYAEVYEAMKAAWEKGIIVHSPPPYEDFVVCMRTGALAFAYPGTPDIYMCRTLIFNWGVEATAQTLIHEAAHVIGYANECDATILEQTAMRKAGKVFYRNGYSDNCGL